MAKNSKKVLLPFNQRLILNQYIVKEAFGFENLIDLSENLKTPKLETIDDEGHTGFLSIFLTRLALKNAIVTAPEVEEWDLNIVSHLKKINATRDTKLSLKYFQWLSLLFVEYYLDKFFNHKQEFLEALNEYLSEYNEKNPESIISTFMEDDLNKIAFWNATGSGKTILMHINYYQYLHYSKNKFSEDASFILLTPKEGLSTQHLEDFNKDGIPAKIYNKSDSRWMDAENTVQVIEVTKLAEKDEDKKVAVSRFGTSNVLFVDEGHRGSTGDTWYKFRNQLCETGFSFEYSATFGQAVSGNDKLVDEYAKCIIFDYSYRYFYKDGYGKDYSIINLQNSSDDRQLLYLTACLLAFYQQKKFYSENTVECTKYNIENPLFVFVGSSVNAVRKENKKEVSDVVEILLFLQEFISNTQQSIENLKTIISGNTGFLNTKNEDIFAKKFPLMIGSDATEVYKDILYKIFNCTTIGATMHLGDVRGIQGEISIWVGDNQDKPFGLINVGDDSALLKLCEENGLNHVTDSFGVSRFDTITKANSSINILIGSKKFSEGWNCWRVSTMGLMNIGQSEGSEIIQLFGRGVRLKGYNMSLKRSSSYKLDDKTVKPSKMLHIAETLNVFGVHADYMDAFRKFLEQEDIPTPDETLTLIMPVVRNQNYKGKKLYSLRLPDTLDYKKDASKPVFEYKGTEPQVKLDAYSKIQFQASIEKGTEVDKLTAKIPTVAISLFDYDELFFEMEQYKNESAKYNMNLSKAAIKSLFMDHNGEWYTLYIPSSEFDFGKKDLWQNIALSLLKKYFDAVYYMLKGNWETPLMNLIPLSDDDENFMDEYAITIDEPDQNTDTVDYCQKLIDAVNASNGKELKGFTQDVNMNVTFLDESLYNPLLYKANGKLEVTVSPVALVESERNFVNDLKKYLNTPEGQSFIAGKELFLIRNKSRKGIGFFENSGFFPDFILCILDGNKQQMIFVDPHGMGKETIDSKKVHLYETLKAIIEPKLIDKNVRLDSFIVSPTYIQNMTTSDKTAWEQNHVLFMSDDDYISKIFE